MLPSPERPRIVRREVGFDFLEDHSERGYPWRRAKSLRMLDDTLPAKPP